MGQINQKYVLAVLLVALVCVPLILTNNYLLLVATLIGIYIIVNCGLDIVFGYSGQITLGQAGFYAIGAYSSAILSIHTEIPVIFCMIFGGLLSSFLGMLVAIPSVKLVHHFLAMVTIGFGEIIRLLAMNGGELTGAADGISFIPKLNLFGYVFETVGSYYYFVLACVVVFLVIKHNLVTSRVGRAFRSIRDDNAAAAAFGINVRRMKVTAFTVEGFFGGFGGALYAHLVGFISPETFALQQSVIFLTMVLLGGSGTLWGPVIGTVLISILFEALQPFGQVQMVVYGLIIMVVIMFLPRGIAGTLNDRFNRQNSKKLELSSDAS
ncbi:branched-chain amino acid ABC transporter permease [Marinovum sp. 2_MG-2023]|uniref:branched-chain amino acid ABC transporter permease n=1 Tax=Roseobacteraceae TaxID=2854170 RepID=UPI001FD2C87C|nr:MULTISPECIES: branched-chain amino acid ABC transporter permease [Roseobacteraceae]MCJ7872752.1 branched-chain amino acid ABC transporter permease [Phaeobacter sp. J2-8]MDO6729972.1 branched-chain amino acid ABC transporter permease [Marinovum sp. 2_MG-2023]MDO6779786.1 branched-chain amino acid ABC transporter permease [Marinovum sp. 1_MG-2023]